jgi:hypothetical protein
MSPSPTVIARQARSLRTILGQVPRYMSRLGDSPGWLPMYILARWMPARKAHWLIARTPPASAPKSNLFPDIDYRSAVAGLRREGIFTGINLPAHICKSIAAFACANSCFDCSDRTFEFFPGEHKQAEQRSNRMIPLASYLEKIEECAAAREVLTDPLLQTIARHYLGSPARLVGTRLWWTFPGESTALGDRNLREYHFDLLDWRMIKFFFYVRPVDEGTGPHVYVRGSHRRRALRHQLTPYIGHPIEDVLNEYGRDQSLVLLGDAGFGFVEDPFGFHMATPAQRAARLVMEVSFGVSRPSPRRFYG